MIDEIELLKQKLSELSKEELVNRLANYEFIMQHINEEARWWMNQIYKLVRGIRRDYRPIFGVLIGVNFEIATIDIWTESRFKDYTEGTKIEERKIIKVKPKDLIQFEIIEEREEQPAEE